METPILTKSTPEGARDFLVPCRLQSGEFYALPQSPQLFKQLLMIGGFERYYQIARAFRDEDLRADRQPEHTQIDIEMSFIDEEDIQNVVEGMFAAAFEQTLGVKLQLPFPRMAYVDAMARYGSDKPDLRFGMEIVDVTDIAATTEFRVFADAVAKGGVVRGLRAEGGAKFSRKDVDELAAQAAVYGSQGVLPIWIEEAGLRSPMLKFLTDAQAQEIVARLGGQPGDLLLLVADQKLVAEPSLGALRLALANRLGIERSGWQFAWIVNFPMFEYDQKEKRLNAQHHPFTKPRIERLEDLVEKPLELGTYAYDLVLNGVELGSGSIRIADPRLQEAVFSALGLTQGRHRREVRVPGRGHGLRHSAARRHRPGFGPHRDADGRRVVDSRRHRLPEDGQRVVPAHQRALRGQPGSVEGAAHPHGLTGRTAVRERPVRRSVVRPEAVCYALSARPCS